MPFNMQEKIKSQEKQLRENFGENPPKDLVIEKVLDNSSKDDLVTIQGHLETDVHTADSEMGLEKSLNTIDGKYVDHRKGPEFLTVPPINALVEKMRQDRFAKDYHPEKSKHWSFNFKSDQNGSLPKWPKSPDPKGVNQYDPEQWNRDHPEAEEIVKGVTKASIDELVHKIKSGETREHDSAIVAILKQANLENRDLTAIEQSTISHLKIARTNAFLKK